MSSFKPTMLDVLTTLEISPAILNARAEYYETVAARNARAGRDAQVARLEKEHRRDAPRGQTADEIDRKTRRRSDQNPARQRLCQKPRSRPLTFGERVSREGTLSPMRQPHDARAIVPAFTQDSPYGIPIIQANPDRPAFRDIAFRDLAAGNSVNFDDYTVMYLRNRRG